MPEKALQKEPGKKPAPSKKPKPQQEVVVQMCIRDSTRTARCLELRLEDQVIDRVLDILPGIGVRVFQCALRDVQMCIRDRIS